MTTQPIQVRPATATDIPRLIALDHTISSESVWQLELRRDTAEQTVASFREVRLPRSITVAFPYNPRALSDEWIKKSLVQIALVDNLPVGYICVQERAPASVAWVTELVVGVSNRRQGVASTLLASAQNWAVGRSYRNLILEMQSKNLPMIRLAQKFGYEFCGYNDHYYPTQDVVLFFGKAMK
jgi:ribosomal protein S18 acetylase RimI-like enzyme